MAQSPYYTFTFSMAKNNDKRHSKVSRYHCGSENVHERYRECLPENKPQTLLRQSPQNKCHFFHRLFRLVRRQVVQGCKQHSETFDIGN